MIACPHCEAEQPVDAVPICGTCNEPIPKFSPISLLEHEAEIFELPPPTGLEPKEDAPTAREILGLASGPNQSPPDLRPLAPSRPAAPAPAAFSEPAPTTDDAVAQSLLDSLGALDEGAPRSRGGLGLLLFAALAMVALACGFVGTLLTRPTPTPTQPPTSTYRTQPTPEPLPQSPVAAPMPAPVPEVQPPPKPDVRPRPRVRARPRPAPAPVPAPPPAPKTAPKLDVESSDLRNPFK